MGRTWHRVPGQLPRDASPTASHPHVPANRGVATPAATVNAGPEEPVIVAFGSLGHEGFYQGFYRLWSDGTIEVRMLNFSSTEAVQCFDNSLIRDFDCNAGDRPGDTGWLTLPDPPGGGIGTFATFPTVRNCAITSNTAGTFGGGIGMQNETLILVDTEICGNTAKVEPQIGGTGEVIDEGGNVIIESCGEPGCLGDLDLNGLVDGADLGAMFLFWGTAVAEADLDGDGSVGPADLGLLLISWGPCP